MLNWVYNIIIEYEYNMSIQWEINPKSKIIVICFRFHDVNDAGFVRIYIAKSILSLKHNLGKWTRTDSLIVSTDIDVLGERRSLFEVFLY